MVFGNLLSEVNEKEDRDDHGNGYIGAAHGDEIRRLHRLVRSRIARGKVAECLREQAVDFRRQHRCILGMQRALFAAEGFDLEFTQYVVRGDEHAGERADRVEGLREIEAPRRRFRMPHRQDIRIGSDLEQRQSAGEHAKRREEKVELGIDARRDEERGTDRVQREPGQDAGFVGEAADEDRRGQRHDAVAEIERELHQAAFRVRDEEDVLECPDQRIGDVVGETP